MHVSPPASRPAENVVVQGTQGIPKLCDFGLALDWSKDVAVSRAGTPVWTQLRSKHYLTARESENPN